MSTFNCDTQVPSPCQAFCCTNTPINKEVYFANFFLKQRHVTEEVDLGQEVLPKTGDGRCTFLSNTYQCQIYADRPEPCRDFGTTTKPFMACPYMKPSGETRGDQERNEIFKDLQDQAGLIDSLYSDLK